jgi:hypothetical protein
MTEKPPTADVPPADAPTTLPAVKERTPIPTGAPLPDLGMVMRFANGIANSELVPKAYRGKPADIMVAVQRGAELGLLPMQALESIAVIGGRTVVFGDALPGIVMASPHFQDFTEHYEVNGERRDGLVPDDFKHDATAAVCIAWRKGKPTPVVSRFTIADARKAGLLNKDGPWQTHPARMLKLKARNFGLRDAFPDVLRGLLTDVEAHDLPPVEPAAPARSIRRISEARETLHDFGIDREPATRSTPDPDPVL